LVDTLTYYPTVAEIAQACDYTEDPNSADVKARAKQCPYCYGDNWITTDGPFGLSAAQPCRHDGNVNQTLGPVMAPALERRYSAEDAESHERRIAWLERRQSKHDPAFPRVTRADIRHAIPATFA